MLAAVFTAQAKVDMSNEKVYVYLGEFNYKVPEKGASAGTTVAALLGAGEIVIQDQNLVQPGIAAMKVAGQEVERIVMMDGTPTDADLEEHECYILNGTITSSTFSEDLNDILIDKKAQLIATITLKNAATNKVAITKQVSFYTWMSIFNSVTSCQEACADGLKWEVIKVLRDCFKLTGHMLDKGFEKGKSQKLKQIYIDLGTDERLGEGRQLSVYKVKTVAGRVAKSYLGELKVVSVMGDDISCCDVKKGAKEIKAAWDNGEEIIVQTW